MNKLAFCVPVVVAENDDIAMKEGEKYSMWLFDKGLKVRPEFFVPPGYMSERSLKAALQGGGFGQKRTFKELVDTGVVIAGSVDTVIEKLSYYTDVLHASMLVTGGHVGEIPDYLVLRFQEMMAKEVMPAAAGLFQRAIVQSGPGLRMMSRERATEHAEKLLKELGIAAGEVGQLKMLPVEQLFEANARIHSNAIMGWGPVVDGQTLPQHPFDPVAPAISASVPLIIGTNKDEATLFLLADTELSSLDETGLRVRVRALVGDAAESLIAAYRHAYPQASPSDLLTSLMSDRMMRMHSITQAERKYEQGAAPVFMYLFTWETPVLNGRLKSCHALEIPFAFDNLARAGRFTGESPERFALAENMSEAWLAFARDGVPSYHGLPAWPAYDLKERATMIFDKECRVENDPAGELRRAWNDVPIPSLNE